MNRRQKNKALMIAGLLLAFTAVKTGLLLWWQERQPEAETAACDVRRGCTLPDGVSVTFSGRIAAGSPFNVKLANVPDNVAETALSFSMKDMDMGFNRFKPVPQGGGVWRAGQIRLPFCVAGRRDYVAEIDTGGGRVYRVEFRADE